MITAFRALLLIGALCAPALAQTAPQPARDLFDAAQRADGARIVPDRFLRGYDPLTIFFDADAGPAAGGPEDRPARFVTLSPAPAGAWTWLGARALQFRPAEPWRPLQRYETQTGDARARLVALLPAPEQTEPADGAEPSGDLDRISLTFAAPVDVAALARLTSVEVRHAPGVSPEGAQVLTARDFDIRALERVKRDDRQTYVLRFRQAIPDGRVAILRLKLSDEPGLDDPTFEMTARSAEPFVVSEADCGRGWNAEKRDLLMRCSSYEIGSDTEEEEKKGPDYKASNKRRLTLTFSAQPEPIDILRARNALRISPPVDDLEVENDGRRLRIVGKFLSDRAYEISLSAGALSDRRKRPLARPFVQKFAFAADAPAIAWDAGKGVVERFGPQFLPLRGRGYDRADVRIHAIDPLARDFWPFPADGVETDDGEAPALPGAGPATWSKTDDIDKDEIGKRIKALGSPSISELVALPIQRGGAEAKFGLDLRARFAKIAGPDQPGAYLVGLRPTDGAKRLWLRVQATDLSLSAVEERAAVRFAVTSLASAAPVAEAAIRIEGLRDDKFVTLAEGRTDAAGLFVWNLEKRTEGEIRRLVVTKGLDTLVVGSEDAPSEYARENWTKPEDAWLGWTTDPETERAQAQRTLCHVFTERPIYRPEEPVHIKGFVRAYVGGRLSLPRAGGALVVSGPSNQEWRIPVKLDETGGFYHKFDAATPATGDYAARFEPEGARPREADEQVEDGGDDKQQAEADESEEEGAETADTSAACGVAPFKKEAYRLPTFELSLNGPQIAPLDGEFNIDLLARYFAGGLVADRPVKWRAAQFPHAWTPPGREGFLFSTDSRFSGEAKFKSSAVLERDGRTDAGGAARMTFDTAIEPTAQPRRYSIEATVTGEDDIQVRNVVNVIATPPFALGLKAPRYVEKTGAIEAQAIAVDGKGAALAGLEMTARFIRRNWSSVLQASDFAQGSAKYVTQTIDETLVERKIASAAQAQALAFEAREAGVYLVQLEAYDRLGRRQQVSVDFFVGGQTPVTWARAPARAATVSTDKDAYAPGETATLVVQSPFQRARALVLVEEPGDALRTEWIDIENGYGRFQTILAKEQTPKLAVHFLIMRGRVESAAPTAAAPFDQGKPVTIAATKWVTVTPVKNIVTAKLDYPARARPGQEVEATLRLTDDTGAPVAGNATFWMVDQAVLSLAKERPLDPLPSFIVERPTKMAARDTRNLAFGILPLEEIPGGDAGLEEWGAETNVSVRKNFTPVPIYLPNVKVGPDGLARIKIKLPDTLTVFKLRAKATSGTDRFGYAVGEMLIRQELVAQPALPRFVRPGDRFDAGLIARVVEGPGGAGLARFAAQGVTLADSAPRAFEWAQNRPARIDVAATVPEPKPGADKVALRFEIVRDADKARDAVEVSLPVRPDRTPQRKREIVEIAPGASASFGEAPAGARAGSFRRTITLAGDPTVVRLVAGLQALVEYPYGCTEQRIARAGATVALKEFAPIFSAAGLDLRIGQDVKATQQAIEQAIDSDGLVAFWPRARGNVSLTAWSFAFLGAAERAGEPVDRTLLDRLANVLKLSLRSDYARLLRNEELRERVEALLALAEAGRLDESYVAELARRADFMPNVSVAEMASAAARAPNVDRRTVAALLDTMWGRVRIVSRNGAPAYGGQTDDAGDPTILPSETRALAEMTRAVALGAPSDPRLGVLRDGLLRLGDGDGWGSTNATAAALRALAAAWRRPATPLTIAMAQGLNASAIVLDANAPVARRESVEPFTLTNRGAATVVALVDSEWAPAESGARAAPVSEGFALQRTLQRVVSNAPPETLVAGADGAVRAKVGDVIEEIVELVNPEDRTHVAISLPLASGLEPLNPNIATAPPEARPSFGPTLAPSWVSFADDHVFYAYERLPKGNYRFAFRTRALTPGDYTAPPGLAETMYRKGVQGLSAGKRLVVER